MLLLVAFSFFAGIFTVLSPCILPILPVLLSASTAEGKKRPLGIILGLVISFTFFTLALTTLVHATGISPNFLRYLAITLIIIFGLVMIFPRLSLWFAKITAPLADAGTAFQSKGNGFWGGIVLGSALGLLWTPCAGPILAAIVALVATQTVTTTVILLTLSYSLGSAIPMFLIAYGGNKIVQSSKMLASHAEQIRQFFGVLMIVAAIAIAFHWDMFLQQQVSRFLPTVLIEDNAIVKNELEKLQQQQVTSDTNSIVIIPDTFSFYGKSPEITGIVNWINSPPLSLMQLKGKVVLIDFWTYSCINCLRTLPYLEKWYKDYKDKGLVIIGVHTPEFEFEKDPQNVAEAASRLGVFYPIAQDNDYKTWQAFSNHYWPAHYLIDQKGNLRMVHFGEGSYVDTENAIRRLLGLSPLKMKEPEKSLRLLSTETYLGFARGKSYTSENEIKPDAVTTYDYKKTLEQDQVGLRGPWKVEDEKITSDSDDNSFLDANFLASQIYLVLSGSSKKPVQVYMDGKFVKEFLIDSDRKYDILDTEYGWHKFSLKIPKGISAYAFTFGDEFVDKEDKK